MAMPWISTNDFWSSGVLTHTLQNGQFLNLECFCEVSENANFLVLLRLEIAAILPNDMPLGE